MKIQEHVDIRDYCTFKVGGQFRYLITVRTVSELVAAYSFAKEKNLPVKILGGGSNMVFPDGVLENVVLKIEISGFDIVADTSLYTDIAIGAGENWDSIVAKTVSMGLSGIEAMSAIPGTCGATPVQNVGAYGQEAKDTILSVEVFDIAKQEIKVLSNDQCHFSYRESIFKQEAKDKYVITSVTYRLSKLPATMPNYPGVKKYFIDNNIADPTLQQIRDAIIFIRSNKLPDPKEIPSVGSFFKNPIVEKSIAESILEKYPSMLLFPASDTHTKVPAGALIDLAGLKGKDFGPVSIYPHNALVLVNNGGATRADVVRVKDEIIQIVKDQFGIILETEPEFV
jgi:UDP-N-acetylmuramate dehydrogenase